jgi:hypothetical protein
MKHLKTIFVAAILMAAAAAVFAADSSAPARELTAVDMLARKYMGPSPEPREGEGKPVTAVYFIDPNHFEDLINEIKAGGEYTYIRMVHEAGRDWETGRTFAHCAIRPDKTLELHLFNEDNSFVVYAFKKNNASGAAGSKLLESIRKYLAPIQEMRNDEPILVYFLNPAQFAACKAEIDQLSPYELDDTWNETRNWMRGLEFASLAIQSDGTIEIELNKADNSHIRYRYIDPSTVAITKALDNMDWFNFIIEPGVPMTIKPYDDNSDDNPPILISSKLTNRTVILSVKDAGSTGATLTGNTLNTTGIGTVIIRATVPDGLGKGKTFTQDITLDVVGPPVIKGDFTVRDINSGWILTDYSGKSADVVIPRDLGITVIGQRTFSKSEQFVTSVVVPEGVTRITRFTGLSNLKSITLPSSLQTIGENAFSTNKLESLTIPVNVTDIGRGLISGGLKYLTVQATQPPVLDSRQSPENLTTIYVPRASVAAYKTAPGWRQYAELIEPY